VFIVEKLNPIKKKNVLNGLQPCSYSSMSHSLFISINKEQNLAANKARMDAETAEQNKAFEEMPGRIVSGRNLEMGTEHVMDVQIRCYGCP
jgi:hypothetical protein